MPRQNAEHLQARKPRECSIFRLCSVTFDCGAAPQRAEQRRVLGFIAHQRTARLRILLIQRRPGYRYARPGSKVAGCSTCAEGRYLRRFFKVDFINSLRDGTTRGRCVNTAHSSRYQPARHVERFSQQRRIVAAAAA